MKKLYITLLCIGFGFGALAQSRQVGGHLSKQAPKISFNHLKGVSQVTDTLFASLTPSCNDSLIEYYSTDSLGNFLGFVTGGNVYGDKEKAQFINTTTSGTVYSAMVLFATKLFGAGNENFKATVMDGDATNGPGNVLGTSQAVTYANIDTSGMLTTFNFNTPVNYNGGFFISTQVGANPDANGYDTTWVAIYSTHPNCTDVATAWEKEVDDTWNPLTYYYGNNFKPALYVFAEVDATSSGLDNDHLIARGSDKVIPNPANGQATLIYSLLKSSDIHVKIYDVTGKLVKTINPGMGSVGLNAVNLDASNLQQGLYIYNIQTKTGVRSGRFSVVR